MTSFSQVVGMDLADADYDLFVDAAITGSDRQMALSFLKVMPKNMRGDFVYVDPSTGKILSNRLDLLGKVNLIPAGTVTTQQRSLALAGERKAMAYPPIGGANTGLYIRWFSPEGVNALFGFATPPCDAQFNSSNDDGNMYFNAYSASSSGSIVDAGVVQGEPPRNSQTLNAFINIANAGELFQGWSNLSTTWQCGTHLGMMYGIGPTGTYAELMVGVPTYDPTQFQLPPSTVVLNNAAWNFFPNPAALQGTSGTWNGIPSTCMTCSVARMFTLAESGSDGSCYGACNNTPDGRWDQVVGGDLVNPCQQNPTTICTIEYATNWIAGENDYNTETGRGGVIYSEYNDQSGYEGLNDNWTGSSASTASVGRFSSPLPTAPPAACAPDSYGYCTVVASSAQVGSCNTGNVNPRGVPIYLYDTKTTYYVFQMTSLLEEVAQDSYTVTYSGVHCSNSASSWAPAEPKTQFGDPNLP